MALSRYTLKVNSLVNGCLAIIYSYFCWLMLQITLQYIPIQLDVAFLAIKQDFIHLKHYQIAFFTHVFTSVFVLLAGFTQFSAKIRRRYPFIHRYSGWLYVGCSVLFAAPSGFVIGWYANGGVSSQIAFCLLAILWFLSTIFAMYRLFQGKIIAHRAWMIRSFSLALSAITLRAWKYLLVAVFQPRPMDIYQMVAWLGWVLNVILAEIMIFYYLKQYSKTF